MAANNHRGNMRPASRSHSFLAIGLFIALCILGFNYWNLSARNAELSNDVAVFDSELRLVNAKKVSAEKRSEATLDKVRELEEYLSKERAKLEDMERQLNEKLEEEKNLADEVTRMKSENNNIQALVQTCEERNKALISDMENVKVELEKLKNTPPETTECTESSCAQFVAQEKDKIFRALEATSNLQSLKALAASGVDIGAYADKVQALDANVVAQPGQGAALDSLGQPVARDNQPAVPDVAHDARNPPEGPAEEALDKLKHAAEDVGQLHPPAENPDNNLPGEVNNAVKPIVGAEELPVADNPDDERREEEVDDNDGDDGTRVLIGEEDKNIEEMRQNIERDNLN